MESKAGFFSWSLVNIGHVPCFNLKVSSSLRPGSREATTGRCTRGLPGQSGVEFYWSCPLDRYQPKKSTHKYKNSIWFHWLPCKELFYGHVAGNFPNNSFSLQLWWWVCRCRNTLLRYDPQQLENKKNGCIPSCERSHIPCSKASSKMMFLFLRWKKCEFPGGGHRDLFDAQEIRREASSNSAELLLGWMSTAISLKKGVQIRWVFGKGTFTQKKGNFVNLSIWNFKMVSLSSQPKGSQLGREPRSVIDFSVERDNKCIPRWAGKW